MDIVLGVSGGIAAYKAVLVLRQLRELGHQVRVIPTEAALKFVGTATWEALSGHPVNTGVFDDAANVEHVNVGQLAELMIVAPATADLLSRAAVGRANDLLSSTLLMARCPVVMAPAMHTEMWLHPATVANVATLRHRGVHVIEPATGRLTGHDSGPGRLPDPELIVAESLAAVAPQDLTGRHIVISAGGTREPLDPVRYLGNYSTGRQGVALAQAAARRGARVTLVAANLEIAAPPEATIIPVRTAIEMRDVMYHQASSADVVVMAAAVADYRPDISHPAKLKKDGSGVRSVRLVENPDILAGLAAQSPRGQVVVGFAAETGDDHATIVDYGAAKARRKGADLLVVNAVGLDPSGTMRGFGTLDNAVTILDRHGSYVTEAHGSKEHVAHVIIDTMAMMLSPR